MDQNPPCHHFTVIISCSVSIISDAEQRHQQELQELCTSMIYLQQQQTSSSRTSSNHRGTPRSRFTTRLFIRVKSLNIEESINARTQAQVVHHHQLLDQHRSLKSDRVCENSTCGIQNCLSQTSPDSTSSHVVEAMQE